MRISLIIPTLRVNRLVERCIKSFEGQYDELIVVDDIGKSLAYKQNKGMRLATGDFLVVCNDDIESNRGTLKDLCNPDKVLSPMIGEGVFKVFHAHLFCLPRRIYAEVGGFDETCPGVYHIDTDLWLRLKRAGYNPEISERISVDHNHPSSTISTLPPEERDEAKTKEWFINKWGIHGLKEVNER